MKGKKPKDGDRERLSKLSLKPPSKPNEWTPPKDAEPLKPRGSELPKALRSNSRGPKT